MIRPTALICGITGQDGRYLAKSLLDKGYLVWGTSRDVQGRPSLGLDPLGFAGRIRLLSMSPIDFRQVCTTVEEAKPDEIYFLAAQSSVGLSFIQPVETMESIAVGTLNILEACRLAPWSIRVYLAGSGECFGETGCEPADESTPFRPKSPYAVAKASAFWLANNYREAHDLFVCTGILFNHESPLRPARYVTQKIAQAACRIANGSAERLTLGDLSIIRDWGWAPDYAEAMWLMLQQPCPRDFVVATGVSCPLEQFVAETFSYFGLNWADHVDHDPTLLRPNELRASYANPEMAHRVLNWTAENRMPAVARLMAAAAEKHSAQTRLSR